MLGMAALSVGAGDMSLGDFILINQFMLQLFLPLGFLGFVYREIKAALANIERLFKVLEEQPRIAPHSAAPDLALSAGDIQFRQIEFAYRESEKVLKGFNLHIKGGQTVALVGSVGPVNLPSANCCFDFMTPHRALSASMEPILERSTFLPSEKPLRLSLRTASSLTIPSGRISVTATRRDRSDIEQAVKAAHLADFVDRLPDGLDTLVGERGLKISGGERQRVAIARAVLKQAHILIFDEATSSLDSHSEQAVLRHLKP